MRRWVAAATAVLALGVVVGLSGAQAATLASWADLGELSGTSGAYTATVQVAPHFPTATMTSTSRSGSVGRISGASTWLAATTQPGAVFGSSRNQPYYNLRPAADNATGASVTTYTFADATPPSGWAFVLGDIDADQVQVSATDASGRPVAVGALGFQGVFNYCSDSARGGPSCGGNGDVPSWDAATATLTGNTEAADTSGASGWFEPTVPLSSLTFTFTERSGFPTYQTWFAALSRDITGTVTGLGDQQAALRLIGPDGAQLAETTTAADGTYAFDQYPATAGYTVEIVPPDGLTLDESAGAAGQPSRPADLSATDATVDFALRAVVPVVVSGTVTDTAGDPVADATVTLTPDDGGTPLTTTTETDGTYGFPDVGPGTWTPSVQPPAGYEAVETSPPPFTVPAGSEAPITGEDFVVGLVVSPTSPPTTPPPSSPTTQPSTTQPPTSPGTAPTTPASTLTTTASATATSGAVAPGEQTAPSGVGGLGGEEPPLATTGADVVHVAGLAALLVALGLAALVVRRTTDRRS